MILDTIFDFRCEILIHEIILLFLYFLCDVEVEGNWDRLFGNHSLTNLLASVLDGIFVAFVMREMPFIVYSLFL
jgi:hypothetical protein